ncbi:serine hydrolase domain-containing protein, partial [Fulvivirga sp.]
MKLNVDIFMQIARNEKRYSRSTKKILALHLIAALFLITPLCSIGQKSEQFVVDNRSIDINHLNSEIESVMDTVIVPGMSLAVIDQGEVVFSGAYGVRGNDEEVTEGTTFQAASLSKVFLMYAALKMADEGLLDLNKPVYQYLPNPRLSHDERYLKITSRMLLFHTSGIEDWENENNPQILEIISDPDERFVYSGEGYNYLADAIAEILNKPIVQYMKELVY